MTVQEAFAHLRDEGSSLRAALSTIYGADEAACVRAMQRITHALTAFRTHFGDCDNICIARAPGRVNMIGEHTDYNGFPVMPMAISSDVYIVATARDDSMVEAYNVDGSFPSVFFAIERKIPPFESGFWGNYIKSALQGLVDYRNSVAAFHGMNMVVEGNVPVASGLSSSAAFTVAVATTALALQKQHIPPLELAKIMAHSDHYVGMASGGMDQTVSILGEPGACLKIDFDPIAVTPVKLPTDCDVVVCHSRVEAAKAGNARDAYNLRTVECRFATAVLHALARVHDKEEPLTLREWCDNETQGFEDALEQIHTNLHENGYTLSEIAEILPHDEAYLRDTLCISKAGTPCSQPVDGFQLKKRARHVISEAQRVEGALALLQRMPENAAHSFGALMDASHASCRDDYGISCPELEELTHIARDAGAYGSRLTGAGFGGCTVSLVPKEISTAFCHTLDEKYYIPRNLKTTGPAWFIFTPAAGARVLTPLA